MSLSLTSVSTLTVPFIFFFSLRDLRSFSLSLFHLATFLFVSSCSLIHSCLLFSHSLNLCSYLTLLLTLRLSFFSLSLFSFLSLLRCSSILPLPAPAAAIFGLQLLLVVEVHVELAFWLARPPSHHNLLLDAPCCHSDGSQRTQHNLGSALARRPPPRLPGTAAPYPSGSADRPAAAAAPGVLLQGSRAAPQETLSSTSLGCREANPRTEEVRMPYCDTRLTPHCLPRPHAGSPGHTESNRLHVRTPTLLTELDPLILNGQSATQKSAYSTSPPFRSRLSHYCHSGCLKLLRYSRF